MKGLRLAWSLWATVVRGIAKARHRLLWKVDEVPAQAPIQHEEIRRIEQARARKVRDHAERVVKSKLHLQGCQTVRLTVIGRE